jgi:carbonic anhydrase
MLEKSNVGSQQAVSAGRQREQNPSERVSSLTTHVHNLPAGAFTVLAVLLEAAPASSQQQQQEQQASRPNPCLAAGLASVPSTAGTSAPCSSAVNPADLLPPAGPGREQYVAYRGSLTTPPCSEGVDWLVWTQPVALPQQQVDAFRALARMNARPVQPLNDRGVAANCLTVV